MVLVAARKVSRSLDNWCGYCHVLGVVLQDTVVALLAPDGHSGVVFGENPCHMRCVMPVWHGPVVDEAQRPSLNWLANSPPDVNLSVSNTLLKQFLCSIAQELTHPILACHVVPINVGNRQRRVGELLRRESPWAHVVLAYAKDIRKNVLGASNLLDQLGYFLEIDILNNLFA